MSKDAYYFRHDSNAHRDMKMVALRRAHGMAGYGVFWLLVEVMREQTEYKIMRQQIPDLAYDFRVDDLENIVNTCCNLGLFVCDGDEIWAPALCRNMEAVEEKRHRAKEAGKIGALKRWHSDPIATPLRSHSNERKGKDNKGEKRKSAPPPKKQKYGEHVALSDAEHSKLTETYGPANTEKMIAKLNAYKGSSGKKYKSDYQAILNWVVEATNAYPQKKPRDGPKCPKCGAPAIGNMSFCGDCGLPRDEWKTYRGD